MNNTKKLWWKVEDERLTVWTCPKLVDKAGVEINSQNQVFWP